MIDQAQTHSAAEEVSSVSAGSGEWLTPRRFALLLAVLVVGSFPQVIVGLQTFVLRDFGFFAYPLAHFQRECFWRGELPLWNPYNNCGLPFLAQWNTMALYPPSLLYLLLPLEWSLSFFCLLHLYFGGLGMYLLAYRWTGSRLGAALAGVAFAFNGLSLNMLMWPSHIATLAWMPWVVYAVERAFEEGRRTFVLAALAGTFQMLAGGPETIMLTWLFLLMLWLSCLVRCVRQQRAARQGQHAAESLNQGESKRLGPVLWRFPVLVLLVTLLAAAQLLPFLDLVMHSQREQGYADTRWSMPGWGWANFLVPMVFGYVWKTGVFFQYDQGWTSSYYLGIGIILLAALGLRRLRERRVVLLTIVAGFSLLLAFGDQTFVYPSLRKLLPQLSMVTYPIKFVTAIAFALPLLAAFGMERLEGPGARQDGAQRKRLVFLALTLGVLIGAILLSAWWFPFPTDVFSRTLVSGTSRAALLVLMVILLLALLRPLPARLSQLLAAALVLVFWADVLTHAPSQNPTVDPSVYTPGLAQGTLALQPEPALGKSRVMVSPFAESKFISIVTNPKDNFLVKRLGYFANCNLLDGMPKVNGFFSLYPRECGQLTSLLYASTNAEYPRLQDFMSVSHVTAPGEFTKWQPRGSFLPVVTAGLQPLWAEDEQVLGGLKNPRFDPSQLVFLPADVKNEVRVSSATNARVTSSRFENQRVEMEVDAAEPSLVVISQTYYHRWRALVDGRQSRLLRANYAFQAVEVPAGHHRVSLVYHDSAFKWGTVLSGLGLLGCAVGWFWPSKRFLRQKEVAV